MKGVALMVVVVGLIGGIVLADGGRVPARAGEGTITEEELPERPAPTQRGTEEKIPKTFHGSGEAFKEGGRRFGEGFRGIGRGIKKTFTGDRSKEDYQEAEKLGTGARDIGRGTAGGGRAVGRGLQKGFKQNEQQGE